MKQIVVLSGKGGTGKTTFAACLVRHAASALGGPVVAVDADVDAANLALLLEGTDGPPHPFTSGRRARVDPARCAACGACAPVCRFAAIEGGVTGPARVVPLACEGCGACALVCPTDAVAFDDNVAGSWWTRRTADGWLVHAALGVAQDSSGKLVAAVRVQARALAARERAGVIVVDGPPGVGCPVHAAITGADELLAVTEPTPSGEHDLERLLRLAAHFGVPTRVIVNKHDLSPDRTRRIERLAAAAGSAVIGLVPFDPGVPRALAHRRLPTAAAGVAPGTRAALQAVLERAVPSRPDLAAATR